MRFYHVHQAHPDPLLVRRLANKLLFYSKFTRRLEGHDVWSERRQDLLPVQRNHAAAGVAPSGGNEARY
jgi:hypothetical protein